MWEHYLFTIDFTVKFHEKVAPVIVITAAALRRPEREEETRRVDVRGRLNYWLNIL